MEFNIRYIESDDWKSLIEIWDDFSKSQYAKYDTPHMEDEATVRDKVSQWAKITPENEHMFFAVCLDERLIGYIDFHKNGDGYELGYCFHSAYHGKGYARKSLKILLAQLANNGGKRFTARTALDNLPSVKLLNSLGFQKIGEERVSFYKDENGNDIYFDGGIFMLDRTS